MPSVVLFFTPDHFKTQGMCNEAVEKNPHMLGHVPDQYKTQEMCDKAVRGSAFLWYVFSFGL